MGIKIRQALTSDVDGIFIVRTSVIENHLSREEMRQMGITETVVAGMLEQYRCAWVAVDNAAIVGLSMILPDEGCLFAAFVLPDYESQGIGRRLVIPAEEELFKRHECIWLETEKNSRAVKFYKHLGWGNETDVDEVDVRLEKRKGRRAEAKEKNSEVIL